MSWSDPCSNCSAHRADCDCGNFNKHNNKKMITEKQISDIIMRNLPLSDNVVPMELVCFMYRKDMISFAKTVSEKIIEELKIN